jgi:hypothetical protein
MLSLGLLEPALAMAAFSWIMWVTLPWAFGERLDFLPLRKKAEERAFKFPNERMITELDLARARDWLTDSHDSFLAAGIVFLMRGFLDAASNTSFPSLFTNLPTLLDELSLLTLLFSVFALGVAVYRGQQAIKFISRPSRIDEIARFGSFYATSLTKQVMSGFVIGLGVFNIVLAYIFFPLWHASASNLVAALQVLDVSFVLGAIGLGIVLLERPSGKRRVVGPILVILPWAYLMVLIVLERLIPL